MVIILVAQIGDCAEVHRRKLCDGRTRVVSASFILISCSLRNSGIPQQKFREEFRKQAEAREVAEREREASERARATTEGTLVDYERKLTKEKKKAEDKRSNLPDLRLSRHKSPTHLTCDLLSRAALLRISKDVQSARPALDTCDNVARWLDKVGNLHRELSELRL